MNTEIQQSAVKCACCDREATLHIFEGDPHSVEKYLNNKGDNDAPTTGF